MIIVDETMFISITWQGLMLLGFLFYFEHFYIPEHISIRFGLPDRGMIMPIIKFSIYQIEALSPSSRYMKLPG